MTTSDTSIQPSTQAVNARAKQIKLLVLDVDGVLSDGKLYFSDHGQEMKTFNTLDGHGIKMLQQSGVEVGIITGRTSPIVTRRAGDLGIAHLIQGREDKYTALQSLLATCQLTIEQVAFMGDDYPDLSVMCHCGLALTVPNAHHEVRQRAHWQSQSSGGKGAVREACDLLMKAQNTYDAAILRYTMAIDQMPL